MALANDFPNQVASRHVARAAKANSLERSRPAGGGEKGFLVVDRQRLAEAGRVVFPFSGRLALAVPTLLAGARIVGPDTAGTVQNKVQPAILGRQEDWGAESSSLVAFRTPANRPCLLVERDQGHWGGLLGFMARRKGLGAVVVAVLDDQIFEKER